jgi:hypothetical protein
MSDRRESGLSPTAQSLCALALCGSIGVITGLSAAVLLDEEANGWFFLVLGFTALLSIAFEWIRGIIDGAHEPTSAAHMLFNFLVLAFFELLVAGVHRVLGGGLPDIRELAGAVVGRDLVRNSTAQVGLAALVIAWIGIGVAVGISLLVALQWAADSRGRTPGWASPLRRGMAVGAVTGGVVAPVVVLGAIVLARVVLEVFEDPHRWKQQLQDGSPGIAANFLWMTRMPAWVLAHVASWTDGVTASVLTVLAGVVMVVCCCWYLARDGEKKLKGYASFTILGVCVIFLQPIVGALIEKATLLAKIAALVTLIWALPSALLAWLVPYLDDHADHPRIWGALAWAAGSSLLVLALLERMPHVFLCLAAAALFFVLDALLRRTARVQYYWPALAISIATLIAAITHTEADFLTVQDLSSGIIEAPIQLPVTGKPPLFIPVPRLPREWLMPSLTPGTVFGGTKWGDLLRGSMLSDWTNAEAERRARESRLQAAQQKYAGLAAAVAKQIDEAHDTLDRYRGAGAIPLEILGKMVEEREQLEAGKEKVDSALAEFARIRGSSSSPPPLEAQLANSKAAMESSASFLTRSIDVQKQRLATTVQVTVSASVGFWLTLGVLASWKLHNGGGHEHAGEVAA